MTGSADETTTTRAVHPSPREARRAAAIDAYNEARAARPRVGAAHRVLAPVQLPVHVAEVGPAVASSEWLINQIFSSFFHAMKQGR